jgi:hypothetical protein
VPPYDQSQKLKVIQRSQYKNVLIAFLSYYWITMMLYLMKKGKEFIAFSRGFWNSIIQKYDYWDLKNPFISFHSL